MDKVKFFFKTFCPIILGYYICGVFKQRKELEVTQDN